MTDPVEQDGQETMDGERNLPEGVTEEYREVVVADLGAVGTNQTTLGEGSGGIDDQSDDLDDDGTPLDDSAG